jgi:hypothetical protein
MMNAVLHTGTIVVLHSYRSICPREEHCIEAPLSAQQRFRPRVPKVIDHPRDARLDAKLLGEEPAQNRDVAQT